MQKKKLVLALLSVGAIGLAAEVAVPAAEATVAVAPRHQLLAQSICL